MSIHLQRYDISFVCLLESPANCESKTSSIPVRVTHVQSSTSLARALFGVDVVFVIVRCCSFPIPGPNQNLLSNSRSHLESYLRGAEKMVPLDMTSRKPPSYAPVLSDCGGVSWSGRPFHAVSHSESELVPMPIHGIATDRAETPTRGVCWDVSLLMRLDAPVQGLEDNVQQSTPTCDGRFCSCAVQAPILPWQNGVSSADEEHPVPQTLRYKVRHRMWLVERRLPTTRVVSSYTWACHAQLFLTPQRSFRRQRTCMPGCQRCHVRLNAPI